MANRDIKSGATYYGNLDGSYAPQFLECEFAAADTVAAFIGDFVKLTGESSADGKRPIVAQCATTDAPVGVLESVEPDFANESFNKTHHLASTLQKCNVIVNPDAIFSIKEDSAGGSVAAASVGLNTNFVVAAGDATTGMSGMELDSSAVNTTAALDLQILRLNPKVGNAIGTDAEWLVTINTNTLRSTTGN